MARSKNGVSSRLAFESLYAKSRKVKVPQETEDLLLDAFTQYCENHGVEDIQLKDIKGLFRGNLRLNTKLVEFIQPEDFRLEVGEGEQVADIMDFEKYLYNGALLLKLNERIDVINFYWEMIVANLKGKNELSKVEQKSAYREKIYLKDIEKLTRNLKQETPVDLMINMLKVGNGGERVWLNYIDFALMLGRIGELGE